VTTPSISIIIPVRNAAGLIPGCLASIHRMRYPGDELELLVVDNGSTDESASVAERHGARVLTEPRPGPYAARNLGAARACGEILAFTDADCVLDSEWASAIWGAMAEFDAVCGLSLGAPGGPIAGLIQHRYEENLRGRASARPSLPVFDTRNAAVRRSVFQQIGGFDARLDDLADDLLGIAVLRAGGDVGFCEGMRVTHVHPETLRGVWTRQVRHGRNMPRVLEWYQPEVIGYFPGIERHRWMYRGHAVCRLGRVAASWGAAVAGGAMGAGVQIAAYGGAHGLARRLFDLFCRAGTIRGMAKAT
jgi:glycosyltransferase involved in cell wall biosynthesis